MMVIVGLGNPGKEYTKTRHNFGFMALDAFASACNVSFSPQSKFQSDVAELAYGDVAALKGPQKQVFLVKPRTFMNLSGEAVAALVRYYKVEPKHVWVVADDLDLPLGKIRVRFGGETGGHHGLDDIVAKLGTKDFWRIRLGVRGEVLRREHIANNLDGNYFVMSPFPESQQKMLERTIQATVEILRESLERGELKAHTHEVDGLDEHAGDQPGKH